MKHVHETDTKNHPSIDSDIALLARPRQGVVSLLKCSSMVWRVLFLPMQYVF